jgi:hypothetical protein
VAPLDGAQVHLDVVAEWNQGTRRWVEVEIVESKTVARRRFKMSIRNEKAVMEQHPYTTNEKRIAGSGVPEIFVRSWCPGEKPKAIFVIVQGFNAHSGYYGWVAGQLTAVGMACMPWICAVAETLTASPGNGRPADRP